MNFWSFLEIEPGSFAEDGQFLMLFMTALLLLWLAEDKNRREFRQFSLVMLLLLLCPVSVRLLLVYQTGFYGREDLWEMLPVTAMLAYGLAMASSRIMDARTRGYGSWEAAKPKRKEYEYEIIVTVVLTAVLFLCGTLTPAKAVTAQTSGTGAVPREVMEVLEALEAQRGGQSREESFAQGMQPAEEAVTVLAPDEVASWVRITDGQLRLPYGRDLWEPELAAYTYDTYTQELRDLHDWINGMLEYPDNVSADDAFLEEMFLERCADFGCKYLIFSAGKEEEPALQEALSRQSYYTRCAGTGKYVIYAAR